MSDVRFEPCPRRVRALARGRTVIDSRHVRYGYTEGFPPYPKLYVPLDDVDEVALGELNLTDALSEPVDGLVTFRWAAFDTILEEAEQVHVHARDPYHRVDVLQSDRHIEVFVEGHKVADSTRAMALFETGLPTRWYLPWSDVRADLLRPTDTRTGCPYKGFAHYWAVEVDGKRYEDLAWGYPTPLPDAVKIAGRVCFYDEKVDVRIDGEAQTRPDSPFA